MLLCCMSVCDLMLRTSSIFYCFRDNYEWCLFFPSFVVCRHVRVGHDLMEGSLGYTAMQLSQNDLFFVGALLLCTPIDLLQVPTQLLDAENSIQYTTVHLSTV